MRNAAYAVNQVKEEKNVRNNPARKLRPHAYLLVQRQYGTRLWIDRLVLGVSYDLFNCLGANTKNVHLLNTLLLFCVISLFVITKIASRIDDAVLNNVPSTLIGYCCWVSRLMNSVGCVYTRSDKRCHVCVPVDDK